MIEVRLFATLRKGRGKIFQLEAAAFSSGTQILEYFNIPLDEVAIFLINGFHAKPESIVKDGDIVAIFPPVGGG
ncbi:MAG: MoaD/ThiS family protein [Eubacteriales bacterium]|nr:MoaD/ThiS family protein [Eubacteriales bacterium]